MPSPYRTSLLFLLIAIPLAGLLSLATATPAAEGPLPHSYASEELEQLQSYWEQRIEVLGGPRAYKEFIASYKTLEISQQHTLAHLMGAALYRTLGVRGLASCDSSFSFGCFHEFLGQAIHAEGIEAAYTLNEACFELLGAQALSCQHGIGHGIVAYLGYERSDLKEAAGVCSKLPHSDGIGGCFGGIFMEYNMRTMLSLDGVGVRERGAESVHEPCSSLPEDSRTACYYWQPQWWGQVLEGSTEERYREIGVLCREAEGALTERCFEGAGNIAGQSTGYDPIQTIAICKAAAGGSGRHELACRSSAASSYFVIPEANARAQEVCAGLRGDSLTYCLRHADNTFNQLVRPK